MTVDFGDRITEPGEIAIELVHLRVDIDPRVESGSNVAIPPGGRRVQYASAFKDDPALIVSPRGSQAGKRLEVTLRDTAGFVATFLDGAGSDADGSIDFIASGYGRKLS